MSYFCRLTAIPFLSISSFSIKLALRERNPGSLREVRAISKLLINVIAKRVTVAQWRCGGSVGGSGDVVAQMEAVEMWWLSWRQLRCGSVGDPVAQLRCGGSVGDIVAQWRCGG